jgi:hypothetical protein
MPKLRLALSALVLLLATRELAAEPFVDLGLNASRIEAKIANQSSLETTSSSGVHLGFGLRRTLSGGGDIGVRLEIDDVDSYTLLAVRPLDYRFNVSERVGIGVFAGVARLSLATPAYGYYLGAGVQWKRVLPNWSLSADLRYGDKLARDNVLPEDPQGGSPDNFYSLSGISVYLSRSF